MSDELSAGVRERPFILHDNLKPEPFALCPTLPPFPFLFLTAQSSQVSVPNSAATPSPPAFSSTNQLSHSPCGRSPTLPTPFAFSRFLPTPSSIFEPAPLPPHSCSSSRLEPSPRRTHFTTRIILLPRCVTFATLKPAQETPPLDLNKTLEISISVVDSPLPSLTCSICPREMAVALSRTETMTSFNHVELDEAHTPARYLRVSICLPGRSNCAFTCFFLMLRQVMFVPFVCSDRPVLVLSQ